MLAMLAIMATMAITEETLAIPTRGIAEAKNEFSVVFASALQHRPQAIQRHGHSHETVVAISLADLRIALADSRFDVDASFGDGEVIAGLERFSLLGAGVTFDEALDELVGELRVFCSRYIEDLEFYRRTSARSLLPWVLRFQLTPLVEQRDLLLEPPTGTPEEFRANAAVA